MIFHFLLTCQWNVPWKPVFPDRTCTFITTFLDMDHQFKSCKKIVNVDLEREVFNAFCQVVEPDDQRGGCFSKLCFVLLITKATSALVQLKGYKVTIRRIQTPILISKPYWFAPQKLFAPMLPIILNHRLVKI